MPPRQASSSSSVYANPNTTGTVIGLTIVLCVLLIVIFAIIITVYVRRRAKSSSYGDSRGSPNDGFSSSADASSGTVCMNPAQYRALLQKASSSDNSAKIDSSAHVAHHHVRQPPPPPSFSEALYLRDKRVLNDQLYPPLNRTEADVLANLPPVAYGGAGVTGGRREDTYRLLGYLKANPPHGERDTGNNVWKCMGRMKDRNTGEFYAVPAKTNDDIKVPLTQDIIVSERLRDIYTLPTEMRFNSPFFHATPYTFVELPKTDLPSDVYV